MKDEQNYDIYSLVMEYFRQVKFNLHQIFVRMPTITSSCHQCARNDLNIK